MDRKIRYAWWGVLALLLAVAGWRFLLPHNTAGLVVEKNAAGREIVVYISGAVEKPGLIRLPLDARLNDALKQANPLPEANIEQMNPAEKLKDGQKINVPAKPTALAASPSLAANPGASPASGSGSPVGINMPVAAPAASASSQTNAGTQGMGSLASNLVNINTAGASELDKLPGIGPALAERIIQYRNEHGLFAKPEDLQKVSGIGPKTYEKMASRLTVGP